MATARGVVPPSEPSSDTVRSLRYGQSRLCICRDRDRDRDRMSPNEDGDDLGTGTRNRDRDIDGGAVSAQKQHDDKTAESLDCRPRDPCKPRQEAASSLVLVKGCTRCSRHTLLGQRLPGG